MARPALPRASFLGTALRSGVAPASGGGVTVPLSNPALEMEARSYNSLAQRLNAFSQQAFGVAEQRAKTAGEVYGITNAPTLEQVESAAQLGQSVEVPGDATSGRVFDQAAYAGSMAVVESRYATAAQKAMTDIFVAADADATITPQEVQMQMQAAVTEYTKSLGMVDAASAAKLTNKLGIMANSKYVEFSRSYANRMQKQMVDGALVAADDHLEKVLPSLITGYNATTAEVSLDTSILSDRANLEASLETQGVGVVARNKILDRYDKAVIDNKINAIVRLSDDVTGTDPQADVMEIIKRLKKGNLADRSRQEIFDSLTPEQKRKSLGDLFSAGTAMKKQLGDDDDANKAAISKLYDGFLTDFYDTSFGDDPGDYDRLINKVRESKLPPRGDLGKDSLLTKIKAAKTSSLNAGANNRPTDTQVEQFEEIRRRLHLANNHPQHVSAEQLRAGTVTYNGKKLSLPVNGLQGNNISQLIQLADKDESLTATELKDKKNNLLAIIKAAVGAKDVALGRKSNAADTVYARAVSEIENIITKDVKAGKIDQLIQHKMFIDDSPEQRLIVAKYRNRLPTLQRRMKAMQENWAGNIQVMPKAVPLNQFLSFMKAYHTTRNYAGAAKFLSKPEVFDRQKITDAKGRVTSEEFTEEQAKKFLDDAFGATP